MNQQQPCADNKQTVSFAKLLGPARSKRRRGAVILLTAFLLIVMMGMLAFSVDLGYMYTMETQLQRSVDSAALAGAGE